MADRITRQLAPALHWANAVFFLGMLVAGDPGTAAALGGLFAVTAAGLVAHAAVRGPLAVPGPRSKESPPARLAHLALHRGLLAALVAVVVTGLPAGLAGAGVAGGFAWAGGLAPWHDTAINALLVLAGGHVVFNLWREAALGEPAFRRVTGGG